MLKTNYTSDFDKFSKFEVDTSKMLFEPTDYLYESGYLWHLNKIQANLAWDISHGSSDIHVAVIDFDVDISHPDLVNKIEPNFDPFTLANYDCSPWNDHGTTVASFVAAETTPSGGSSNGQLASVGFNTMLHFYNANVSRQEFLAKALHACNVMNADVIVSCAGGALFCSPDLATGEDLIVQEILNNGTVIVMAAGNGLGGTHCGSVGSYSGFYPFNAEYDDRVIVVSSTDINDYHYYYNSNPLHDKEETHSHFADVDVCSPGYEVMGASPTDCGADTWPYFGSFSGTSFSSPIVAGLAALILSVNPCLEPADVEYIIKNTTDPIADAANYPGQVGTGRINAYKALVLAQSYGVLPPITTDVTWDNDIFIKEDLEIETGGVLTINSRVHIAADKKIIVKPGGKLIINNGILTNAKGCNNSLWQGIELQGNSSLSQLTPGAQGQVILKNGAVIENAMDGITTIANVEDMSSWDWSKTGGIIKAENSTFRNCRRGIQFLTYNNVHPTLGSNLPNLSTIRNCTFETTTDLPDGIMPYAFISMNEVNGVKLYGNTFQNTNPNANWFTLGMGIYSINASYLVDQICLSPTIPCSNAQKSQFINLHYGIRSTATPGLKAVTVKNSVFDLCHFGVYFSGLEYPTVINNDFIVDDFSFHMLKNEYAYGLYLNQCNGYKVENNNFHSPNLLERGWTGIYVNNSNTGNGANSSNEIYRNTFSDLYSGIVALNDNDGPLQSDGLRFNCETFTGNTYDISVLPKSNLELGISQIQGVYMQGSLDPTSMVRNSYSAQCVNDENQFKIDWNQNANPSDIWHSNYYGFPWQPQCYDLILVSCQP